MRDLARIIVWSLLAPRETATGCGLILWRGSLVLASVFLFAYAVGHL